MTTAPTAADNIDTMASVSTQPSSPEVSKITHYTKIIIRHNLIHSFNGFWQVHQCDHVIISAHFACLCNVPE